jgi:hypothetical protein
MPRAQNFLPLLRQLLESQLQQLILLQQNPMILPVYDASELSYEILSTHEMLQSKDRVAMQRRIKSLAVYLSWEYCQILHTGSSRKSGTRTASRHGRKTTSRQK